MGGFSQVLLDPVVIDMEGQHPFDQPEFIRYRRCHIEKAARLVSNGWQQLRQKNGRMNIPGEISSKSIREPRTRRNIGAFQHA